MIRRPPLLRLNGVYAGYVSGRPVLDGVDLELRAGERLALTGPNGSGKTTLLHVLLGLRPASAGTIEAFGAARRTERDFQPLRGRIGLLFQDPDDQLFCPTVAEDVAFGPRNLGRSRAEAARIAADTLAMLGLAGYEARVPHQLSGGEKRLVALAGVLAMAPEVLLLDEPTAGLDRTATARLSAVLTALPQAMIIVAHDQIFLERLVHRTVLLVQGRILAGPAADVRPYFSRQDSST